MATRGLLLAWVVIAAACSSPRGAGGAGGTADGRTSAAGDAAMASGTKDATMSTIERLQAWAGPDLGVTPWHTVEVTGVELFHVANTLVHRGVAVVGAGADPRVGPDGFRAVQERGVTDATQLAHLAMLFFADARAPITELAAVASQPPEVRAMVRTPVIDGRTLELWAWDEYAEGVVRYRLDLDTLAIAQEHGAQLAAGKQDPVDVARARLGGASDMAYRGAIDMLVAACADPRAAVLLNEVIAGHHHAEARGWAAFQAATCNNADTVAALIKALETDKVATVRKHAADTLGKLGATAARKALDAAQSDPDADVAGAARRALKKLP
jgi:hypothetical protein